MKFIQQRPYECVPTVCAMLLDSTPEKIITEITGDGKTSWEKLTRTPEDLCSTVDLFRSWAMKRLPWLDTRAIAITILPALRILCPPLELIDLEPNRRGVLTLTRLTSNTNGHIVAFDNQTIYDPSLNGPMHLKDYQQYQRFHNVVVTWYAYEPEGKRKENE